VSAWARHLPLLPILAPLLGSAVLLLFRESQRLQRAIIALASTLTQVAAAAGLLWVTSHAAPEMSSSEIAVYALGGWPGPFGIVLVVDRLAALMLALNAAVALPVLVYSFAHSDRLGVHYHALFQLLLMGLNGAFLTCELFNLFVFFEVLLAASYGLLLHGGGAARVAASLHYIVVNLAASLIFLVGVAIIYGASGTLNLAELGARWPTLAAADRSLFEGGCSLLAIAFLIKAGLWPLNFWLPTAYAAGTAPVVAVFSMLTKVGVYAILRVGSLLADPTTPVLYGGGLLFVVGIATIGFGSLGALAAREPTRLIAFTVIISAGTLLAALASGSASMMGPLLFYLLSSVPSTAAFFLLTGMTSRIRTGQPLSTSDPNWVEATYAAFDVGEPPMPHSSEGEVGITIPGGMAFLGIAFMCCSLLVAGLPPLSGFVAKVALLVAALRSLADTPHPMEVWVLMGALLAATLATLLAFLRLGVRLFWRARPGNAGSIRILEAAPVVVLIAVGAGLTVMAEQVMAYVTAAGQTLHQPALYIHAVLAGSRLGQP
jgi:multicomponent K+:H+ antiporter subunit D